METNSYDADASRPLILLAELACFISEQSALIVRAQATGDDEQLFRLRHKMIVAVLNQLQNAPEGRQGTAFLH
jgi:hypothetical protein